MELADCGPTCASWLRPSTSSILCISTDTFNKWDALFFVYMETRTRLYHRHHHQHHHHDLNVGFISGSVPVGVWRFFNYLIPFGSILCRVAQLLYMVILHILCNVHGWSRTSVGLQAAKITRICIIIDREYEYRNRQTRHRAIVHHDTLPTNEY